MIFSANDIWFNVVSHTTTPIWILLVAMAVGYAATRTSSSGPQKPSQSWGIWLEEVILQRNRGPYSVRDGDEEVLNVFPGWAVRRQRSDGSEVIDVNISGYASIRRNPENTLLSLRGSVWLAKKLLKIPKTEISAMGINQSGKRSSTEKLLKRLHLNLSHRFGLLWADPLVGQNVNIEIYAVASRSEVSEVTQNITSSQQGTKFSSTQATTSPDGSFTCSFRMDWQGPRQDPSRNEIELLIKTHSMSSVETSMTATCRIPVTKASLRVVSDVDDTVKNSGVPSGRQTILRNVFCSDVADTVIPEVSEWYRHLYNRGIRFHYVSNGPLAYANVLEEFLLVSKLPLGSITLRSFTGRLWKEIDRSTAAVRKYDSVVKVLDGFPEARFILIGDSGEMDLECYANLAHDRPHQIAAVLLRDADTLTISGPTALDDPTASNPPERSVGWARDRRAAVQKRLYEARSYIPPHIPLRVFRHPDECVELDQIIDATKDS
ncbi:hypothetical protein CPB83DRAFT_892663 [Crepidotus variabilis]|uniref:Phosphatidate phosphatase APP1 catalytic domain-containing protein n=1 Tax=Crepidotus variabilis TaxID=179855 RepID=A0A9P6JSB6_9AGAR|nr:hypothetical protein CPB83DRAFT_892663 [Crepidotus variabilis]